MNKKLTLLGLIFIVAISIGMNANAATSEKTTEVKNGHHITTETTTYDDGSTYVVKTETWTDSQGLDHTIITQKHNYADGSSKKKTITKDEDYKVYSDEQKQKKITSEKQLFNSTMDANEALFFTFGKTKRLYFQFDDKKRESQIFYRTIGFEFSLLKKKPRTISRGSTKEEKKEYSRYNPQKGTKYEKYNASESYTGEYNPHYNTDSGNRIMFYIERPRKAVPGSEKYYPGKNGEPRVKTTVAIDLKDFEKHLKAKKSVYKDYLKIKKQAKENKPSSYWIGIDSVIAVYHYKTAQGGYNKNTHTTYGKCGKWNNWHLLKTAEPWGTATKKSFQSHYKKYVNLQFRRVSHTDVKENFDSPTHNPDINKPDPPTDNEYKIIKTPSDDSNTDALDDNLTESSPNILTGNYSDKYNIGEAIPTTEDITNEVEASRWYGRIKFKEHKGSKNAVCYVTVSGTWLEEYTYYTYTTNSKGETVAIPHTAYRPRHYSHTHKFTNKQKYKYYNLTGFKVYQLEELNVDNKAFGEGITDPRGTITYGSEDDKDGDGSVKQSSSNVVNQTVPYTVKRAVGKATSTGTIYKEYHEVENVDVNANNIEPVNNKLSYHVYIPKGRKSGSIGGTYYSEGAIAAAGETLAKQISDSFFKSSEGKVKSYHDELIVNNREYLNEKTGPKDTYDKNNHLILKKNESTEKNALIDYEGSCIRTIPVDTLNGPYDTTMGATYVRFMNYKPQHKAYLGQDDGLDAKGNPKKNSYMENSSDASVDPSELDTEGEEVEDEFEPDCIMDEYEDNEPVLVFSPVIAPISIQGEKTQRSEYPGVQRLLLDGEYTVKFEWKRYFHFKGYDNPAGWMQFVKNKEVAFPFSVKVNGVYYEPSEENNGYTDYIPVGVVDSFKMYIPSWAHTGRYLFNPIKIRCLANNSQYWMKNVLESYEYNTYYKKYIATFDYPVQVDGILYGLQVNCTNNGDLFGVGDFDQKYFNFATRGYEHKTGTGNRFGDGYTRRSADESIIAWWSKVNTLPFAEGKSNLAYDEEHNKYFNSENESEVSKRNGCFKRGQRFTFSLKSIFDVNDDTDIKIKPTYRYVDKDGNVDEDISLYYIDDDNKIRNIYDEKHTRKNITTLDSTWHTGARYNAYYDTIDITKKLKNAPSKYYLIEKELNVGNVGSLDLPLDASLYTGNEEELKVNKSRSRTNALRYDSSRSKLPTIVDEEQLEYENSIENGVPSDETTPEEYVAPDTENHEDELGEEGETNTDTDDTNDEGDSAGTPISPNGSSKKEKDNTVFEKVKNALGNIVNAIKKALHIEETENDEKKMTLGSITKGQYKQFMASMQTWYGQYDIPETLKVVKNSKLEPYKNKGYDDPLWAYMDEKNGINMSDSIFEEDDGFLVLNFEIELKKNGETKLYYFNTADNTIKDMWQVESGRAPKKVTTSYDIRKDSVKINVRSGDIAVIDLRTSCGDDVAITPWMLN